MVSVEELLAGIAPARGDLCCFRLYFANDLLEKRAIELLKNMPRFLARSGIKREETLQHKPGAT